ncbi:MAG: hypothetical protein Q9P44_09040 [Anaerolineae bacterium]|nr:hypothetical protein [Anaerolineae bacterium]
MASERIKKLLKDGYEEAGFDVVDELSNGETILRYPEPGAMDVTFKITDDDIEEYAEMVQASREFRVVGRTGMVNQKFREQLLTPLDNSIDERDLRDFFFKRDNESDTYVELDKLSLVYANFFRFDPDYMRICLDRLFSFPRKMRQQSRRDPLDIRHTFVRLLGIRVFNINARSISEAVQISDEYIDSSLFTLAYEYDIPLMLANDWPATRFERYQRIRRNAHRLNGMIVPDKSIRGDLGRLYQAGLASQIPAHQFLSFYQILELFFQDVENAGVLDTLYNMLRGEEFRPNNESLSRIVSVVKAHESSISQATLLEQLLRQHVGSDAIRGYIQLLGGNAEESISSLSRRLARTRDVIVHAGQDTAPLPVDNPMIARDVPLVKFLAERVILATREA